VSLSHIWRKSSRAMRALDVVGISGSRRRRKVLHVTAFLLYAINLFCVTDVVDEFRVLFPPVILDAAARFAFGWRNCKRCEVACPLLEGVECGSLLSRISANFLVDLNPVHGESSGANAAGSKIGFVSGSRCVVHVFCRTASPSSSSSPSSAGARTATAAASAAAAATHSSHGLRFDRRRLPLVWRQSVVLHFPLLKTLWLVNSDRFCSEFSATDVADGHRRTRHL